MTKLADCNFSNLSSFCTCAALAAQLLNLGQHFCSRGYMLFSYKIEMEDSGRDFSQGRLCSLCPEVGLISAAHSSPEEPGSFPNSGW